MWTCDIAKAIEWFLSGDRLRGAKKWSSAGNRRKGMNEYTQINSRNTHTPRTVAIMTTPLSSTLRNQFNSSNNTQHSQIDLPFHTSVDDTNEIGQIASNYSNLAANHSVQHILPAGYTRPEFVEQSDVLVGIEVTAQDWSISIADNVKLKDYEDNVIVMQPTIRNPKLHNVKDCKYFGENVKNNHFALMLHPTGWVDPRNGTKRSALDVFMTRVILSEIFEKVYLSKRSIRDVRKEVYAQKYVCRMCKTKAFCVYNEEIMAAIDSIYEKQAGRDKMRAIMEWLQFGCTSKPFTCVQDIINAEE